jgi:hypothetical protein
VEPKTSAGRALYLSDWNPGVFGEGDEGDPFLLDILAIEAEAAAPYREALLILLRVEPDELLRQAEALIAADSRVLVPWLTDERRALLRREVE